MTAVSAQNPSAPAGPAADSAIGELSYEQARDELIQVVGQLEQGSETLEHSLQLWERGEALAQRCEQVLLGARTRLDAARAAKAPAAGTAAE